jgi:hypothetical protein
MRCLGLLAVLLVASTATAQVPQRLGYQGRLLKADRTPVTGAKTLTYALFASETSTGALWSEQQDLLLTDGFYSTYLGSVTPFPPGLFDGSERFLEVSVDGAPLSPRQLVASVAYSLRAGVARDVAGGGTVDAASVSVNGQPLTAPGTVNAAANPVDWTRLKGVPAGLAAATAGLVLSGSDSNAAFNTLLTKSFTTTQPAVVIVGGAGWITLNNTGCTGCYRWIREWAYVDGAACASNHSERTFAHGESLYSAATCLKAIAPGSHTVSTKLQTEATDLAVSSHTLDYAVIGGSN